MSTTLSRTITMSVEQTAAIDDFYGHAYGATQAELLRAAELSCRETGEVVEVRNARGELMFNVSPDVLASIDAAESDFED